MVDSAPTLDRTDPRIEQLDRAAVRAHLDLIDAIEEVGHAGLPAEVISRYASVPVSEVELILREMDEDREAGD